LPIYKHYADLVLSVVGSV